MIGEDLFLTPETNVVESTGESHNEWGYGQLPLRVPCTAGQFLEKKN